MTAKNFKLAVVSGLLLIALVLFGACGDKTGESAPAQIVRTWEDIDGLCAARLMGSELQVRLEPGAWADIYGFNDFAIHFSSPDAYVTVGGIEGDIVDIYMGSVPGFSGIHYEDVNYDTPMLAMLMADGTVHWLALDPYSDDFESRGALPFLEGAVALQPGVREEGIGEPTLFALDAEGRRCDIGLLFPHTCTDMRDYSWVTGIGTDSDGSIIYGYLSLLRDGTATYEIARALSPDMAARYEGSYHLAVWEGEQYRPGILELKLQMTNVWDAGFELPPRVETSFFVDPGVQDLFLALHLNDGDSLLDGSDAYWLQLDDIGDSGIVGSWIAHGVYNADGQEFTLGLEFFRGHSMRYWCGYPFSDIVESFEGNCWVNYDYAMKNPESKSVIFSLTLTGGIALENMQAYDFYGKYDVASAGDTLTVHFIDGSPLFYGMPDEPITFARSFG